MARPAAANGAASILTAGLWRQQRLTRALVRPAAVCRFSSAASSTAPSAAAAHAHAHAAPAAAAGSSARGRSFIEIAKREGAASLVGPFPTAGAFDSCLDGLQITRMDSSGEVEGWMTVGRAVENSYGTLHGGAIATLVDVMGTLALLAKDHTRGGVSVGGHHWHHSRSRALDSCTEMRSVAPHSLAPALAARVVVLVCACRWR